MYIYTINKKPMQKDTNTTQNTGYFLPEEVTTTSQEECFFGCTEDNPAPDCPKHDTE